MLNYNIWGGGGFRKMNFGGMKILWIFFGGLSQALGVISMHFRVVS